MSLQLLQAIPYCADSAALYDRIADLQWAVFLDSGRPYSRQGRFDLIAADPFITLVTRGGTTQVNGPEEQRAYPDDPFELIRHSLGEPADSHPEIPFVGGAIGFFGYDLARRLEQLPSIAEDDIGMPEMAVGIYDWALVVDHQQKKSHLVGQGRDPRTVRRWQELTALFSERTPAVERKPFRVKEKVRSNLKYDEYAEAFWKIESYIREGDCYQVNFAQRFSAACEGDPWDAYQALRRVNPSPYGAYMNLSDGQILSCSPERFLQLRDGEVETKPIKGTRPRSSDPEKDRESAEQLRASSKDRAENLMIVDLLRNDLGKSCLPGSIRVSSMFEIESFATVHHLVSTVRGQLAPGRDALVLLRGCFPGGSITGAPKLRAMEIIEELEPNRRGIYCGSIGYIGFDGNMDTNIAIRTLLHNAGKVCFSAGGGIVADSRMEEEYQESLDKAAAMLELFKYPAN
jgi:para-aminobenzoate synthetase component 1